MAELTSLVCSNELDAVNIMLSAIGEAPVSTLTVSGLTDVSIAKTTLARINREVQAQGWDFNTDRDFQLAVNVSNQIPKPPNALQIDAEDKSVDIVERNGLLYDRKNNTFTFTAPVKCKIVRYFPFEWLPEAARYYIAIRAARVFQKEILGDEVKGKFIEDDERRAKEIIEDADSETAERNMLNGPELAIFTRAYRSGSYYT